MICAKNQSALVYLQKQFAARQVVKTYIAIVEGHLKPPSAIIDMPIERNPKLPSTFRVGPNGKTAQTQYSVLTSSRSYDLVELLPKTGRTHQLRVHMKHTGHPITGDVLYGGNQQQRLFLHAESLDITLPGDKRMTFKAPLPILFSDLMKNDT